MTNWNYGWKGSYFITINCSNRQKFFGDVVNRKMIFSSMGKIAHEICAMIPNQFSFIHLEEFQIMPEHVHILLVVKKSQYLNLKKVEEGQGGFAKENSPMIYQNISRVIRWFKGRCSYDCRKLNGNFKWQSTFHDRLVRSKTDFIKVKYYIQNNPKNYFIKKTG